MSNTSDDHITRRPMPDRDRLLEASFLSLSFLSLSRTPSQSADNKPLHAIATMSNGESANTWSQSWRSRRRHLAGRPELETRRLFRSDYQNQIAKPETPVGGTVYPEEHPADFRKKKIIRSRGTDSGYV